MASDPDPIENLDPKCTWTWKSGYQKSCKFYDFENCADPTWPTLCPVRTIRSVSGCVKYWCPDKSYQVEEAQVFSSSTTTEQALVEPQNSYSRHESHEGNGPLNVALAVLGTAFVCAAVGVIGMRVWNKMRLSRRRYISEQFLELGRFFKRVLWLFAPLFVCLLFPLILLIFGFFKAKRAFKSYLVQKRKRTADWSPPKQSPSMQMFSGFHSTEHSSAFRNDPDPTRPTSGTRLYPALSVISGELVDDPPAESLVLPDVPNHEPSFEVRHEWSLRALMSRTVRKFFGVFRPVAAAPAVVEPIGSPPIRFGPSGSAFPLLSDLSENARPSGSPCTGKRPLPTLPPSQSSPSGQPLASPSGQPSTPSPSGQPLPALPASPPGNPSPTLDHVYENAPYRFRSKCARRLVFEAEMKSLGKNPFTCPLARSTPVPSESCDSSDFGTACSFSSLSDLDEEVAEPVYENLDVTGRFNRLMARKTSFPDGVVAEPEPNPGNKSSDSIPDGELTGKMKDLLERSKARRAAEAEAQASLDAAEAEAKKHLHWERMNRLHGIDVKNVLSKRLRDRKK